MDGFERAAASHPLGHPFELLGCFIEDGLGFLRLEEVEISLRDAPHNPARLVL